MIKDFINYILDDILDNFSADRVVIACIHSNSFKNYEYYSKVFSVSYEVCRDNTMSIKDIVKDIPLSVLVKEQDYYTNDMLIIKSEFIQNKSCLAHLDKINVSGKINILIKYKEMITGILSIQYCKDSNNTCPSSLSKNDKAKLEKQVAAIASFI